jgi:hypothetical protein
MVFYISEDGVLHCHRRENLKSHNIYFVYLDFTSRPTSIQGSIKVSDIETMNKKPRYHRTNSVQSEYAGLPVEMHRNVVEIAVILIKSI